MRTLEHAQADRLRIYAESIDGDAWLILDQATGKPAAALETRRQLSLKAARHCVLLADMEIAARTLAFAQMPPIVRFAYRLSALFNSRLEAVNVR